MSSESLVCGECIGINTLIGHSQIIDWTDDSETSLDLMVNPDYPVSRRIPEVGILGTTKISVFSGVSGGILLFERTSEYDGLGRTSIVKTDDVLNRLRLTKTLTYDPDGKRTYVQRETFSF